MNFREVLQTLISGHDLSHEQMYSMMTSILSGTAPDSQAGAFLAALAAKGESSIEISAAAQALRDLMLPVQADGAALVDIVGTGGDGANLFNVSTASSFVASAAGALVAKHNNRGVSSSSGSADVLESAGIYLDLEAPQVARCIDEIGLGFMFAPVYHHGMRHASVTRKELGVRTIFNIAGPLANPAGARHQLIGVYEARLLPVVADAFRKLSSVHTMVVHSEDGLDEISIAAPTLVCEMQNGNLSEYRVTPEQLGLKTQSLDPLRVENSAQSLELVVSALSNEEGPARDMVALNAGAALYVADRAASLKEGVDLALRTIAEGKALAKLKELADFTHSLPHQA